MLERLEKEDFELAEYDDIAVRQLIEQVVVTDKKRIIIRLKGGFEAQKEL